MASLQASAFFCVPEEDLSSERRRAYGLMCVMCSLLGSVGAIHQIRVWQALVGGFRVCRKPCPNPSIIMQIAVADLFAAISFFIRGLAMVTTPSPNFDLEKDMWIPLNGNVTSIVFATMVEVFCQYAVGVCFMWSVLHALDTYLQLNNKADMYSRRLITCAWVIPAFITLAGFTVYVGFPEYPSTCPYGFVVAVRYSLTISLLAVALLANPVIYFLTATAMERQLKESGLISYNHRAFLSAFKLKYVAIVVAFTLCWMPNVVDAILHVVVFHSIALLDAKSFFFSLWMLEAILNPLQGLMNCAIYGQHMFLFKLNMSSNDDAITNTPAALTSDDAVTEHTPILSTSYAYGS